MKYKHKKLIRLQDYYANIFFYMSITKDATISKIWRIKK